MDTNWDAISNLDLIENGLLHVQFERGRAILSHFRIAREAHLVLYRSMIEALRGSANESIIAAGGNQVYKYQRGGETWKEIHPVKVKGQKWWRFSNPSPCTGPAVNNAPSVETPKRDFLIPFYYALAMVQSECFMSRFVMSKTLAVEDNQMKELAWLHENVRNEYEHFVPKAYMAPITDLMSASQLSLLLSHRLLFESGCALPYGDIAERITVLLSILLNLSKSPDEH